MAEPLSFVQTLQTRDPSEITRGLARGSAHIAATTITQATADWQVVAGWGAALLLAANTAPIAFQAGVVWGACLQLLPRLQGSTNAAAAAATTGASASEGGGTAGVDDESYTGGGSVKASHGDDEGSHLLQPFADGVSSASAYLGDKRVEMALVALLAAGLVSRPFAADLGPIAARTGLVSAFGVAVGNWLAKPAETPA